MDKTRSNNEFSISRHFQFVGNKEAREVRAHFYVDIGGIVAEVGKRDDVLQRNNDVLPVTEEGQVGNLRLSGLLIHVDDADEFPEKLSHDAEHAQGYNVGDHRRDHHVHLNGIKTRKRR